MGKPRKYTPDEDAPLLAALQRGEAEYFETLVRKYLNRIFNLAYLLTGDHEMASAAAKSAMVSACRDIQSLRSTARFSTWLAGLVLREVKRLLEFREASKPESGAAADLEVATALQGEAPELTLEADLRNSIRALPPELAEVLVLRYVRGYSLERLAEVLQLREEILISRLFEAQEKLARSLKQRANGKIPSRRPDEAGEALPHPEIRRAFSAYLDNSSEEMEKNAIRKHLGSCGSCREALAELEWVVEHLKSLQDVDPPQGLASAIMAEVRTAIVAEPVGEEVYQPRFRLPLLVAAGIFILGGIYWYLSDRATVTETTLTAPAVTAGKPATGPATGGESGRVIPPPSAAPPLRSGGGVTDVPLPKVPPVSPVPLPPPPPAAQEVSPSRPLPQAAPLASQKTAPAARQTVPQGVPSLPAEWGESIPPGRSASGKAAAPKGNGDEVAVLLRIVDPEGSQQEIERAVTALGGEITGRAYSSGNDILYTRIDVGRFVELMARLGKIGRIVELPQLPDEATGSMDLVIRW